MPATVRDSNFNPHRLLTLRTRNSAAYKGIYALLDKVAVDRVRNQEYVVPGDGSEDDRCEVGKTQYMTNELPVLVLATGRWSTGF